MDGKDIVKRFFEEGILLTPGMLGRINESNIEEIISKAKNKALVIENLQDKEEQEQREFGVEITRPHRKAKLTPKDFVEYYNNRFNGVRDLLSGKVQAVSINNAKNSFSGVSVIGMVKETNSQGFVLEDPTGEMQVISKKTSEVSEDDVIGVSGFMKEGNLFEDNIVLPDVPLGRDIGKIDGVSLLLTEKVTDMIKEIKKDADLVITADENQDKKTKSIKTTPSRVTIAKGTSSVKILVYRPERKTDSNDATTLLRKRHLSPARKQITGPEDDFIIKDVPDVFWIISDEKWTKIYKGITIISTGGGAVKMSLGTMEHEFIST